MATIDRSEEEIADATTPREALAPPSPDDPPPAAAEAAPTQEHPGTNGPEPSGEPSAQDGPGTNGHELRPEGTLVPSLPGRPVRAVRRVLLTKKPSEEETETEGAGEPSALDAPAPDTSAGLAPGPVPEAPAYSEAGGNGWAATETVEGPPRSLEIPPPADETFTPAPDSSAAPANGYTAVVPPAILPPAILSTPAPPVELSARQQRYHALLGAIPVLPTVQVQPAAAGQAEQSATRSMSVLWRGRGFWLGAIAVASAMFAERLVVAHDILTSIHWYAPTIALLLLGWLGTYRNKSVICLPIPHRPARGTLPIRVKPVAPLRARRRRPWAVLQRFSARWGDRWRWVLAFVALGLNLVSAGLIRSDYYSTAGGLGWLCSLILLLLAFIGERPPAARDADAGISDVEDRFALRIPIRLEIVLVLGIIAVALALRAYRLDDWTMGMHGDEGEAGWDALNILSGHPVSPFLTGWFAQPNFYYWGIALGMKVFGTGLGGLRAFVAIAGTLMLFPFYAMVRQWFGARTAIIASVFLAISAVTIHFSRQEFSNITTPLFLTTGFFFLYRGLKSLRTVDFILAGYAFMMSLYFYLGGRLSPILAAAVIGYLFLLMPVLRVPGTYFDLRRAVPGLGRLAALGRAVGTQLRNVTFYSRHIVMFVIACICLSSAWLVYYQDHRGELDARTQDKLILNNPGRMIAQYPNLTHDPLYIGLRAPLPTDVYSFSPIVFEKTPQSIMISQDGFWPRAMWDQLASTLSILTYRFDASSVFTFTQEPVAKPIEAALIIMGLAWMLWRWRDPRYGALSMWFWSNVLVGGVLTIDAPYMARLVGILPVMAIAAALPLNKLTAEFLQVVSQWGTRQNMLRVGRVATGAVLAAILLWLFGQNYSDYFFRYVANYPFTEVTGQAYFVRQMDQQLASEGRPNAKFYDLGMHLIYWGHGDNRFLNYGVDGLDMVNPSNELPVLDNGDRDVVFMVWDLNKHYLDAIKAYYPDGETIPFYYSADKQHNFLFNGYRVTKEEIAAKRMLLATYTPAHGPAIQKQEPSLGTTDGTRPAGLTYPVEATWTGSLMAPAFGSYRFRLDNSGPGSLTIDGTPVLTATTGGGQAESEIILARGLHDIALHGTLASPNAHANVQWSAGGAAYTPVPSQVLWFGAGKGLLGTIRSQGAGDALALDQPDPTGPGALPILQRRTDGFLGFRDAPSALGGGGLAAAWTGTLTVPQAGTYGFDVFSNGDSVVYIDGQMVVNNRQGDGNPHSGQGQVDLTSGPHRYDLRYSYNGGTGYLEAFWTPPGGAHALLGPAQLHTDGGAWLPGTIANPGAASIQVPLGDKTPLRLPDRTINAHDSVQQPRGIAVDAQGNIYIADTGHHRVTVLGPEGKLLRTIGQEGSGPGQFTSVEDVAIGPDNLLYVLESPKPARIHVFTLDGKLDHMIDGASWCSPVGLTVGLDNMIYLADTCTSSILKLTPSGEQQARFTAGDSPPGKFEQPVDVVVDKAGMIYVIDLRRRIAVLDATGALQTSWPVEVGVNLGASNLALINGVLYVANPDQNTVEAVDPVTGRTVTFGQPGTDPGQFSEPIGVAGGPDGHVYVMDSDTGRIEIFAPIAMTP